MVAFIKLVTLAFGVAFAAASPISNDDFPTPGDVVLPGAPCPSTPDIVVLTGTPRPPTPNEARSASSDDDMAAPRDPHSLHPGTKEEYEARNFHWLRCEPRVRTINYHFTAGGTWFEDQFKVKRAFDDIECGTSVFITSYDNHKYFGDAKLAIKPPKECDVSDIVDAAVRLTRETQMEANLPQTRLVVYDCDGFESDPRVISDKDAARADAPLCVDGRSTMPWPLCETVPSPGVDLEAAAATRQKRGTTENRPCKAETPGCAIFACPCKGKSPRLAV